MSFSLRLPDGAQGLSSPSYDAIALDGTTDGAGGVYFAPKAGSITKVGMFFYSKTGTLPTYRIGVEGVTTGPQPDGTYKTGGTAYVDSSSMVNGFNWFTLGAAVVVAAGESVAGTIRYQSGTVNASNYIGVAIRTGAMGTVVQAPHSNTLTAGVWSVSAAGFPCIVLQYSDGEVIYPGAGFSAMNYSSPNSATNPLWYGTKWTPLRPYELRGVWVTGVRTGSTACDFNVSVFEGATAAAILSKSVDVSQEWVSTAVYAQGYIPFEPTVLTQDTAYRFVIKATTATAFTAITYMDHPDADALAGWWGDLFGCTGTSAPVWTDYDNSVTGFRSYGIIPDIMSIGPAASTAASYYKDAGSIVTQRLAWSEGYILRFHWTTNSSGIACGALIEKLEGELVDIVCQHYRSTATGDETYDALLIDSLGRDVFNGVVDTVLVNTTARKVPYQPMISGVQGREQAAAHYVSLLPFSARLYIQASEANTETGVLDLYIRTRS